MLRGESARGDRGRFRRVALSLIMGLVGGLCVTPAHAETRPASHKIKTATVQAAASHRAAAAPRGAVGDLLVYHQGAVQNTPRVYLSFWGREWTSSAYDPAREYVEAFFGGLGGSGWLKSTTEYCSGGVTAPYTSCSGVDLKPITNPPAQLKGTWIDTMPVSYSAAPAACGLAQAEAGDCDVMLAVSRAAQHFGTLPAGAVVLVMTPSGRSQPGFISAGWCAYHWSLPRGGVLPAGGTPFGYVPFIPDAGSSCGQNSVNASADGVYDGFSIIAGHEFAEAITDPYPGSGWVDATGQENADKCIWRSSGNVALSGRNYGVQSLWSNATAGCVLGPPDQPPTPPEPAGFRSLGGILTSAPALASPGGGRLDVFARGTDRALWHRWRSGGVWSDWQSLGGTLLSEPAAVARAANRLDVFARGADDALWHRSWDGNAWSTWESLAGTLRSGPAVASWTANRLDVFVRGTDDALWHRWWSGDWSYWEPQGGILSSSPAAVSWGPNRMDVFVRGTDLALWHKWWQGGWSAWEPHGGTLTSEPAVSSGASGRLDVFARGPDVGLWRRGWNGTAWSDWRGMGGQWLLGPAAISDPGAGGPVVFAVGLDNAVWQGTPI